MKLKKIKVDKKYSLQRKSKRMNKRGGFVSLFIFMIVAIIVVFFSGIMIYIGIITTDKLHEELDDNEGLNSNASQIIDTTLGEMNNSFQALYWIAIFLIVGMIIAIFIGSYMVTTKPIIFFPYIFLVVIAIIVAVGISIAYTDFREQIADNTELAEVFAGFIGANEMLAYLPLWIAVIGIVGGVIMASRMGAGEQQFGGGYYG